VPLIQFISSIASLVANIYAISLILYLLLRLLLRDRIPLLALLNNFTPWYFTPLIIFLPLALLLQEQWLIVLMLVPTVIALLWFGPYYVPHRPTKSPERPTLRVLTFNIWGNNPCKPELGTWLCQVNADLVFLQEIPKSFILNELPRLKDLYPHQFAPIAAEEWWNSVTLSRYPIVSAEDLLTWDIGVPALHKVVIDVEGQLISAYNVHMVLPFKLRGARGVFAAINRALHYDERERRQKIGQMLDYLKAERNPYIVAGDFNMSCYSAVYGDIAKLGVDSFREAGTGFGMTWPIGVADHQFGVQLPTLRIDYIWHSPELRAVEITQQPPFGSDHLPLAAIMQRNN
jgi:endonuclease/exonuclease/phosphatase (EEP) superfamily protein YafD